MVVSKEYDELVGKRISYLLAVRGLTQRQFAASLGYSETNLSQILKGKRGMKKTRVVEAARILNVHPMVLTTTERIPEDQLLILDKFLRILVNPEQHKSYPALKTLIESENT